MQDIFFAPKEQYNQALNPVRSYIQQLTHYIEHKTGLDKVKAREKAISIFKKNFKDRNVKCFEREENGDRIVKDTTLLRYISDNLKDGNILTPTFTSYLPRNKVKSILSEFIFVSVAKRALAKKEAHVAKAAGNLLLADNKNNEQNNLKTYNNSMSGAFAQVSCILYNPSNHSTLTSLTRTMTSLSNANNERIIAGNRYYPRAIDVMNNIVYITSMTNQEKVKEAMISFNLHYPTVQETVKVLQRSSDLYFKDRNYYSTRIIPFLETLSPEMLASICYSGDFYHIRQYNSDFVRNLLKNLSRKVTVSTRDPDVVSKIHSLDENLVNFVHHVFFDELKGKGKDYSKMTDTDIPDSIYATCQSATEQLFKFQSFYNAFFMTDIMPANSFRLRNMVRRAVVLSDTDSTCFTLDEWVKWYKDGEFWLDSETIAMGGAVSYITTQVIINLLRNLSRNLNIDDTLIDKLGMKNEFLWLVHSPAEVSKHYYAYTVLQEGTVLTVPEIEIKGVHLKNSAVPKFVTNDAKEMMTEILEKVSSNQKLKFKDVLDRVIGLERTIHESVFKGEPVFLKRSKINAAESYAQEADKSPYARHTFWMEVFAPKYGEFPAPPYGVIKVPTIINSKTALKTWVEEIEDVQLRSRLADWLERNKKSNLPTIYLNDSFVGSGGIPKEILKIIDIGRIVLDVTMQHRVVMETLGVILYKDKLVSEQFNS